MHQKKVLSIVAVAISLTLVGSAASADDQKPTGAQGKSGTSRLAQLPKVVAGFCAGVVVGTPICFVRKFPQEVTEGAHGFVGSITGNDNTKLLYLPSCVLWLPVAGVVATLESPGYALKNAYTAEKPFTKEQFSMAELDPKK